MYHSILHATDLSENHFHMCQQAVKLAHALNADIYFIHVIEPPRSLVLAQSLGFAEMVNPAKDDAETVIRLLGENFNIPEDHLYVEVGSASQHILEKAKAISSDLIVLGSHYPSHFPGFLGSTAQAIIHHAQCDVLTLRNTAQP